MSEPTVRGDYAGRSEEATGERKRLEHLSRRLNPGTQRCIRARGLAAGWKCLEVGAAEGSMSRWLAEEVGPGGRVVAADIDLRFLDDIDLPNLETRQLDLRSDPLESDHYDLAYCRTILMHLPDPRAALGKLVAALRPGGWLLAQEPDAGPASAVDLDHPAAEAFARITHASYAWVRARGIFDPYFGRRLPGIFASLGLVETGTEATTSIARGGGEDVELYKRTIAAMAPTLTSKGAVSEADLDLLQRTYDDPTFELLSEIQFVAWGRKPD